MLQICAIGGLCFQNTANSFQMRGLGARGEAYHWGVWGAVGILGPDAYIRIYIYIHITYHTYTLLYNAEEWIEIWIRFNYTIYDIYHLSIYTSRLHYKSLDEMRLDG